MKVIAHSVTKYNVRRFLFYGLMISAVIPNVFAFGDSGVYLFHILLTICCGTILIECIINGFSSTLESFYVNNRSINKYLLFYFIWWLWQIIMYFFIDSKVYYFQYFTIYSMMFLFVYVSTYFIDDRKIYSEIIIVLKYISIIIIVIGLLQHFFDLSIYTAKRDGIVSSLYFNPNDFAFVLNFIYAFALSKIAFVKDKRSFIIQLITLLICIFLIFVTNSRMNLVSVMFLTVIFSAYFFFRYRRIVFKFRTMVYVFAVVVMVGLVLFIPYFGRFNDFVIRSVTLLNEVMRNLIYGDQITDNSVTIRVNLLRNTIHLVRQNPLGLGPGSLRSYLPTFPNSRGIADPHGWFVEVFGEMGIAFFLLYLVFYISLFINSIKSYLAGTSDYIKQMSLFFVLSLSTFLVSSISPSSIVYLIPHWVFFIMLLSFLKLYYPNNKDVIRGTE